MLKTLKRLLFLAALALAVGMPDARPAHAASVGTVTVTRTMQIAICGDSINDPALPYQSTNSLRTWIDSHYMTPSLGSYARPTYLNLALTGNVIAQASAQVSAALTQNPNTKLFIVQAGINDVNTAVPFATSIANATTLLNNVQAAGGHVIWIGPFLFGEKSPTGQNVNDTLIDALNAGLQTLVASYSGDAYVDVRTTVYAVQEPLLNAGQAVSGVLTQAVAAAGNGIHPIASGNGFITAQAMQQIQFQFQ